MRILILILMALIVTPAFAATQSVWQPAAEAVCDQINKAVDLYQQGDLKHAHLTAVMSYFKHYDTEIEPAVRITLGGPHVFDIERKFRNFAASMTDKNQIKIVKAVGDELCQFVHQDAEALDAAKVPRQVFRVES